MNFTCTLKKATFFLICFLGFQPLTNGQTKTFTSQPDASCGKDALIADCVPCGYYNSNYGTSPEFNALAWTNSGAISDHRSLIQFDFTTIPPGSVVTSATLYLYYDPTSSNASGQHSSLSGPNEAYVNRILSPWDENTVTWANQPTTDTVGQAYLSQSVGGNDDYAVDVKRLVQYFVNNPSANYGMMLQLASENYYRCLLFASSDYSNPALHPKIVVTYTSADSSCITLQPGSCDGIDALIADCIPCGYAGSNYGDSPEMNALAWTNSGAISDHRSLIYWDLSSIPASSTVQSAYLSLYYDPTSSNAGGLHSQASGTNDAYLRAITTSWDENTVTWNNQPSTTTTGEVHIPASSSPTQDYINIDITGLVQNMVTNPATNFGLMLQLNVESYYRCLLFASSDYTDSSKHPKLEVCYRKGSLLGLNETKESSGFSIYPNPSQGAFNLVVDQNLIDAELTLFNAIGQEVYRKTIASVQNDIQLNLSKGIYIATVYKDNKSIKKKLIID